ncbi:adenylate/guanylate cyclase domain-containing protein [Pelagibius marinus]|uniref:adenylate/guanylate cyclase domain-containing protein n=1 Tax=Pelagibius marinus TaxID=2762760 RepID=UPI0018732E97|nr:adenylate/guanylate cyclase domain-containing protein [Pelagibius marinus]
MRQRISTLLFAILTGIVVVFALGLILIGLRLFEIQRELDRLREESLPRLVKLAQLSQDASATSSIAPALSMNPTRSEFDTLLARIRDKESSQRALIEELDRLFTRPERVEALRRSADLLISNLAGLTAAVDNQIAVGRRLEAQGEKFTQILNSLRDGDNAKDAETAALATQAISQVSALLLDVNRARFARNRREVEAGIEALTRRLEALPADAMTDPSGPAAAARAITELWQASRQKILEEKSAQLSNAFQIKALAEENSLIANRLLSSASNEFWRAGSELEAQVRLVNETTRITLFVILGIVIVLGAGALLVWEVLRKRVFRRLDRMRQSLLHYAEDRQHGLSDPYPDEIGEIAGAMAHYMGVIDQREAELAEKTTALERLSKQLAKYLSPQVYDSIFAGRQEVKVASSRKKLTVFFSDIVGFTETADRLESEELTQLLNHYLTEMSRIALKHGATIDKYIGDAILAFFGDPETRGVREDALACLQMAIDMRRRMRELHDLWREAGIENPLQVRMGIHTGYCTVGNFGSEDRLDYTIIGGAVNIASRLQTLAAPGELLISYETFAHVNAQIACEERGEVEVKGIAYPVATYSVLDSQDGPEGARRGVHEMHSHLRLDIDLAAMTAADREAARKSLTQALRLLDSQPESGRRSEAEDGSAED